MSARITLRTYYIYMTLLQITLRKIVRGKSANSVAVSLIIDYQCSFENLNTKLKSHDTSIEFCMQCHSLCG
jgi:hypothetical protein